MLHNDCHIHLKGDEEAADVLKVMDVGEVEKMILLGPYGETPEQMRDATDFTARIQAEAPDRIIGFCWIEPLHEGAREELERAIADKGLAGCKMIPNHWYPYDETIFPFYEKAQELRVPMIFHAGVLHDWGESSRFCRPIFYEALLNFPKVKFALAHNGWPWTDECLATAGKFRHCAAEDPAAMQMMVDLSPGAPDIYRQDVLDKALKYLGPEGIMWGSDAWAMSVGTYGKRLYDRECVLLADILKLAEADMEKVFSTNLLELMKPME